ncbi:MAG: ChrR family anti-sigma-E factor [Pseudohongiella sp.]|nr:ChrR family anti-sigma-E factor [Pseudohongiella sp.]MDO9518890.1 ChrR family anti-sigma-E factor [Pseudohongiella sp.]MDP2128867.1 ChrR family anti-sigma-E factor [Pseudohongiella sp.]
MVSFHPDSKFLTDFAAGNLPLSEAVCVAAHLEFCSKCRSHVQQLSDVAAQMMARLEPVVADEDGFDTLMQRIEAGESTPQPARSAAQRASAASGATTMPLVVQKLAKGGLQNMSWVQLGRSLRIAPVNVGCKDRQTAIYDIKAGGRMPEHEHRGEEITVLLKGSFSDAEGKYVRGDFVVRHAGERHQPTATLDTDCICLVSLAEPVKPTSFWYRLLEPFVQYRLSGFSN